MRNRNKAFFKIPILTAAIGLLGVQGVPVSAMVTTDSGNQAWSIAELNDFYYEFEAEKTATCGNDLHCRRELSYLRYGTDPKYAALEAYSMSSLVLSSINPSTNTFRLHFRDIDHMAMEMEGTERHNPLTEAYVAWLDSSYEGSVYSFIDELRENHHPIGLHIIYSANSTLNGPNWFPVETEVDIVAPDAHLELNDKNEVLLAAFNDPDSVFSWVDYSSCVNSPSYSLGMECRLMYDSTSNYVYVPFEVEVVAPIEEINSDGQEADVSTELNLPNPDVPESNLPSESSASEPNSSANLQEGGQIAVNTDFPFITRVVTTNYQATTSLATSGPETPRADTLSKDTEKGNDAVVEQSEDLAFSALSSDHSVEVPLAADSELRSSTGFPWWLLGITVIIAGVYGVFWWFILPIFRRSNDKKG